MEQKSSYRVSDFNTKSITIIPMKKFQQFDFQQDSSSNSSIMKLQKKIIEIAIKKKRSTEKSTSISTIINKTTNELKKKIRQLQVDFDQISNMTSNLKFNNQKLKIKQLEQTFHKFVSKKIERQLEVQIFGQSNKIKQLIQCGQNSQIDKFQIIDIFSQGLKNKLFALEGEILKKLNKIIQVLDRYSNHLNQMKSKYYTIQYVDIPNLYRDSLHQINMQCNLPKYPNVNYNGTQNGAPIEDTYSTPYDILIETSTFRSLHPGGWLNTSIIMNYIQFLKKSRKYNTLQNNSCYILNESQTGSMQDISNFNLEIQRKVGTLLYFQKLGMIINQNNNHWYFIGVFIKTKEIYIYDSIKHMANTYQKRIDIIQRYFEYESKIQSILFKKFAVINLNNTNEQTNGSDCGLCTIVNLTYFTETKLQSQISKKIDYDMQKLVTLRIGLHFFLCYLIHCKKKGEIINRDYVQYCTVNLILSKHHMQLF